MTGPILALDLGSSSFRAARFDRAGGRGPVVQEPATFRAERGAAGTFPAESAALVLRRLLERTDLAGVERVVISSQWHTVLAVDAQDRPVSEVFTWESSGPDEALPGLAERLDPEAYRERTGSYLHASYPLAAIWALRERGLRPARWTDLTSWMLRRIVGVEVGWSEQIAAGSGLWNQTAAEWDAPTCAVVEVEPTEFGPVWRAPASVPAGTPFAALAGVEIDPVLADGVCNSFGIGATGPTRSALMTGTSGSLRMVLDGVVPAAPAGVWRYRADRDHTAIGGAISNAGNLVQWIRESLGVDDALSFAEGAPRAYDGLTALPSLAGERGPSYRRGATGAINGLRPVHTREDLAQELVLASIGVFGELTDLMALAEPRLDVLIASGGVVSAAPIYAQLIADATGRDVMISAADESSLLGAALHCAGLAGSVEPTGTLVEPRPAWTAAIAERRERSEELAERLFTASVGG